MRVCMCVCVRACVCVCVCARARARACWRGDGVIFMNVHNMPLGDEDKEHFHLSQTVGSLFLCKFNGLVSEMIIMCWRIVSVFRYSTQKLEDMLSFHIIVLGL